MISGEGKNCNGITYERMVRVFPSKKTLEYQFSYKLFFNVSGILSGEKQRVDRGYDFVGVLQVNRRPLDRQNNCNDYILQNHITKYFVTLLVYLDSWISWHGEECEAYLEHLSEVNVTWKVAFWG